MSNNFMNSLKIENSAGNQKDPSIMYRIQSKDPYVICDVLEDIKDSKTEQNLYLGDLENAIIETGDIVQIYEFLFLAVDLGIEGVNRRRFEDEIIKSQNPKLMCYCMGFVPGINVRKMADALIETRNAKYMELIFENEEYEDARKIVLQEFPDYCERVESAKEEEFFPKSLEEYESLKGNIEKLKKEVISKKDAHLITELANYIEYLNEYKGEDYSITDLIEAQEGLQDPMQSYEFLASVDGIKDKTGLIKSVINSGKIKFLRYVDEYVPNLTDEEKSTIEKAIEDIEELGR